MLRNAIHDNNRVRLRTLLISVSPIHWTNSCMTILHMLSPSDRDSFLPHIEDRSLIVGLMFFLRRFSYSFSICWVLFNPYYKSVKWLLFCISQFNYIVFYRLQCLCLIFRLLQFITDRPPCTLEGKDRLILPLTLVVKLLIRSLK